MRGVWITQFICTIVNSGIIGIPSSQALDTKLGYVCSGPCVAFIVCVNPFVVLFFNILVLYTTTMKHESERLGKNLKRIRTEKKISQGDIARTLNVSRSFISNIENGKTNPTLFTIAKIAQALKVTTSDLMK